MPIIEITSLEHPGVEVFGTLTDAQLRNRMNAEKGIFIAESPKVIRVALNAGYQPLALLCERKHIEGDAADILERVGDIPVYTGSRELLASLTGYTLTRGVLCAMRRPVPCSAEEICASSGSLQCGRNLSGRPSGSGNPRCDRYNEHRSYLPFGCSLGN